MIRLAKPRMNRRQNRPPSAPAPGQRPGAGAVNIQGDDYFHRQYRQSRSRAPPFVCYLQTITGLLACMARSASEPVGTAAHIQRAAFGSCCLPVGLMDSSAAFRPAASPSPGCRASPGRAPPILPPPRWHFVVSRSAGSFSHVASQPVGSLAVATCQVPAHIAAWIKPDSMNFC